MGSEVEGREREEMEGHNALGLSPLNKTRSSAIAGRPVPIESAYMIS